MDYVLGIDLGTGSVKSVVMSGEGKIVSQKSVDYTPDFGDGGFVEQQPSVWWESTVEAVKAAVSEAKGICGGIKISALACSGQMHSSVFLDCDGNVIRPAILWNDTRTTKQVAEIYTLSGGESNVLEYVQNHVFEGFTLPKILWLRENEPDNYARVSKVIMPKDYINYMLTGNIRTDFSDAAGTVLFDVAAREWSGGMIRAAGIDAAILPEAVESTAAVGTVKARLAEELGLSAETKVIAGGADNSCAAVGNGAVSKGQAVISVGTSGTVVAFLDRMPDKTDGRVHLFNYSYPGSFYAMGCMLSAGESLNWLRRNVMNDLSFEEFSAMAELAPAGSRGLVFLPYLFGERCPYNDAGARGVFFGLSSQTGREELVRSVFEGVAYNLRAMFGLVTEFTEINELYITGGGAKSEVWGQITADVLNRELLVLDSSEGPGFGAAMIAGVGCGMFGSFKEAKNMAVKVGRRISPNLESHAVYNKYYDIFIGLYKANREIFAKLKD